MFSICGSSSSSQSRTAAETHQKKSCNQGAIIVILLLLLMAATRLSLVSVLESLGTIRVPTRALTGKNHISSSHSQHSRHRKHKRHLDLPAPWNSARSLALRLAKQEALQRGAQPLNQRSTTRRLLRMSALAPGLIYHEIQTQETQSPPRWVLSCTVVPWLNWSLHPDAKTDSCSIKVPQSNNSK